MRKFILKLIIYLSSFLFVFWFIIFIIFNSNKFKEFYKYFYLGCYNIVISEIEKNKSEKKIIFLGGSNLCYSIDIQKIQDSLNIKTFNLGFNRYIGINREILDIYNFINDSDLIILSPEFEDIANLEKKNSEYYLVDIFKFGLSKIKNYEYLKVFLMNLGTTLKKYFSGYDSKLNFNMTYTKNGNYIKNDNLNLVKISREFEPFSYFSISDLKIFIEKKLPTKNYIFIPPVTLENRFDNYNIKMIDSISRSNFNYKYPFNLLDMTYKEDFFYDHYYHLNIKGRSLRTEKILNYLLRQKKL